MAVLNEADMRKILGPNFRESQREAQAASGMANEERAVHEQIESLDGKKTVSLYFALTGLALILASFASVTGQTLMIQCIAGGAILLAGVGPFFYFRHDQMQMRAIEATFKRAAA